MRNRRVLVVWTAVILFSSFVQVGAQTLPQEKDDTSKVNHYEFSLAQAVDFAKKNNVQVKNALLDVKLQREVNNEITASAFPHLNAAATTTYNPNIATQVIPNFISPATYQVLINEGVKDGSGNPITMPTDFGFIPAQFGTKYGSTVGLSFSQLLFDGQVFVGLQARKTSLDWRSKNYEITEETIKANIHKLYYQLVVSKAQVELLDANIDRLNKLLKDTKIIFDNGFAEKLDVDKVSVQVANLQTEKNKVLNQVSNGYFGLKFLMGMPIKDELVLTDTISDAIIKDGMLDNDVYSYADRKEYQYAQLGVKLNEFNIRRYKLSLLPTIALSGNYAKNAQRNKWDFLGKGNWFTISSITTSIQIPIFNGFATRSKIQQARIELAKTQNQVELLKKNIDNEVITAKKNFVTAIETLDFQKKNMELAEAVYQQTKKKYEIGTGSQLEITASQTELKTAQTNYVSALYDAVIAKVDFLKAIGKL